MTKSVSARRPFLGVTQGGFIPNYNHLYITGEKAETAIARAKDVIARDGMPTLRSVNIRAHQTSDSSCFLGLSFSRMDTPYFLHPDGTMVNLKSFRCGSIHDSIAAHLEARDNQQGELARLSPSRIPVRSAAISEAYKETFLLAASYNHEANMLEKARSILISINKGKQPEGLRFG